LPAHVPGNAHVQLNLQGGLHVAQGGSPILINERKDQDRKHVCNGKDTILHHEEPNSNSMPGTGIASITQLTYSEHISSDSVSDICMSSNERLDQAISLSLHQDDSLAPSFLNMLAALFRSLEPQDSGSTGSGCLSELQKINTMVAHAGERDVAQKHVQQHLWTGYEATDLHVPACTQRNDAIPWQRISNS